MQLKLKATTDIGNGVLNSGIIGNEFKSTIKAENKYDAACPECAVISSFQIGGTTTCLAYSGDIDPNTYILDRRCTNGHKFVVREICIFDEANDKKYRKKLILTQGEYYAKHSELF